ncbi:diaminopimelate decarboxylase [Alicyclobacillus contaminans]|uniref:diaminopimelate decarboxylase n=1 Tax=Alicyclobacillus contaminans TaxID=392016 RepID=UPI00047E0185|nr:diaminopimelate decarboxylase [Alicyclobacillus contaminans]
MPLCGTMRVAENGHLWIGGCDTVELAKLYGTPLFVYDEALIRSQIQTFHRTLQDLGVRYEISYATKAFCTVAMCQLAHQEGLTLDVVSGGELYTARRAGVPAGAIRFHGNNKTPAELEYAITEGVGVFIVDNFHEIRLLNGLAERHGRRVDVLLRIAPGVEAHTHDYIATGQQDSKFGFDWQSGQAAEAMRAVQQASALTCIGLHCHIGSQIFDPEGHAAAADRMITLYAEGVRLGLPFRVLNLGGGFGIRYTEEDTPAPIASYLELMVAAVRAGMERFGLPLPELWIEPGRSIVGAAGVTLYTVGSQKVVPDVRSFLAVDGGMTDNPRLALYGAEYRAAYANRMVDAADGAWTVAGKCCESGDIVIRDAALPTPQAGDLLAVFATGAYNYSMVSHYNRIPHPAVVFVRDGRAKLVVQRETWADVARFDLPLED